jgi:hypothetical protein
VGGCCRFVSQWGLILALDGATKTLNALGVALAPTKLS